MRLGKRSLMWGALLSLVSIADAAWAEVEGGQKSGPWMFNLKLGPAINVYNTTFSVDVTSFALVLDGGYAVVGENGYVIFAPQFQIGSLGVVGPFGVGTSFIVTTVILPVGFQYDIPLPLAGLFLSPRATIGYAARVCDGCSTGHWGFFAPEIGVKYIFYKRWNVGIEPFSLPIFFGGGPNHDQASISYRVLVYGGINF